MERRPSDIVRAAEAARAGAHGPRAKVLYSDLLAAFMSGHFGYGNLAAPVWFVGMEEHGGHSEEEIALRLAAWSNLGRRVVSDVRDYHRAIGVDRYWVERPPIQRTWGCLIRVLLASKGVAADTDAVRQYQRDRLGRAEGESCLLELMPLPAPSINQWPYAAFAVDPSLVSRETYLAEWRQKRVGAMRELVRQHRPQAVVFYGSGYSDQWTEVAGAEFGVSDGLRGCRVANTVFVVAKHPAAHGTGSAYFARIGAAIASQ